MSGAIKLLAVAMILSLTACLSDRGDPDYQPREPLSSPRQEDSRIIGLVGTISGPDSWRGEDAFEGADAAVGVLNRSLAEGERPYELITLDDEGDAGLATELVAEIAGLPRAVGVIYAGPPEGLPPAERALARAGIPALLTYGDLYGARRLSTHIFQISPSLVWEARRIAAYFLTDRRYERVGALVDDSFTGQVAADALESAVSLAGGSTPVVEVYPPGTTDFEPHLARLEQAGVEGLAVAGSPGDFAGVIDALGARGSAYRNTELARTVSRTRAQKKKDRDRAWRPQVAGFDLAISPLLDVTPPAGTVASDTYGRAAHYLPIPSLERFRRAFAGWWDRQPLGWEQRAYQGVLALNWAEEHSAPGADLASALEKLRGQRFGALGVTLGPDDHTFVGLTTVGLWVVPRADAQVKERASLPETLMWVPLSRGFAIDGETTDILAMDWKHLFKRSPPRGAPAPKLQRLIFGVTTSRKDPVH